MLHARLLFLFISVLVLSFASASEGSLSPENLMPVREVILEGLDKVTARVFTIKAKVGQEITFGNLRILVKDCRVSPPEEAPETLAFLEIDEIKPGEARKRVFSGWMFASTPALHAMEHPVYDVWVKEGVRDTAELQGIDTPPDAQPKPKSCEMAVTPEELIDCPENLSPDEGSENQIDTILERLKTQ